MSVLGARTDLQVVDSTYRTKAAEAACRAVVVVSWLPPLFDFSLDRRFCVLFVILNIQVCLNTLTRLAHIDHFLLSISTSSFDRFICRRASKRQQISARASLMWDIDGQIKATRLV